MASQEQVKLHLERRQRQKDDEGTSEETTTGEEDGEDENGDDIDREKDVNDDDDEEEDETSEESSSDNAATASTLASTPARAVVPSKPVMSVPGVPTSRSSNKMRIKLSLKLPTKANAAKLPTKANSAATAANSAVATSPATAYATPAETPDETTAATEDSGGEEVNATVVDSDDAGDDDAVVAVVEGPVPSASLSSQSKSTKAPGTTSSSSVAKTAGGSSGASTTAGASAAKRRPAHPSRPIRLPPISSPGLLMPAPSTSGGGPRLSSSNASGAGSGKASIAGPKSAGLVPPNAVFHQAMTSAGYTKESRTGRPHRGSSVTRNVGDMFDSNVKLALHFPDLIPKGLLSKKKGTLKTRDGGSSDQDQMDVDDDDDDVRDEDTNRRQSLARKLIASLASLASAKADISNEKPAESSASADLRSASLSRKRKRPCNFNEMVPVSLTVPYPESFLEKRLKYVEDVEAREKAIVAYQEAHEEAILAREMADSNGESHSRPVTVTVPPIPEPPTPPRVDEFYEADDFPANKYEDKYPLYFPSGKKDLVAHLDQDCFHVASGRYFGLRSNFVADPSFIGANAPGIGGVHASGGAGLATSSSGSGNSGGMALTLSSSYQNVGSSAAGGASVLPASAGTTHKNSAMEVSTLEAKSTPAAKPSPLATSGKSSSATPKSAKKTGSTSKAVTMSVGSGGKGVPNDFLKPTATAATLRKLMDVGGSMAESLKDCIIKAAVHASRSGRHGRPFKATDGEVYPDISKAFAAHAGIKPCQRCKNNKQGAYHCRLRRKHKDPDHDGGDSPGLLEPLFRAPIESLLCTKL